jgi:hypothetical protein
MEVKRVPYGISNFEVLIREGYAYVDKTSYIALLEAENNPYEFFLRPRKFGKSLLTSILSAYYEADNAAKFQELFGGLAIGKNPTPKHNSYAVLNFDFSGLDTVSEERFTASFYESVRSACLDFLRRHSKFPDVDKLSASIQQMQQSTRAIDTLVSLSSVSRQPLFIIIDEYDQFANDLIAMGNNIGDNVYRRMVSANGIIRDFYETLKIGTKTAIARIFITGVSPVMINDLTSGFNIADNISLYPQYSQMLGFTPEEVARLAGETGIAVDAYKDSIKKYYNGYRFSPGSERVYNPGMVLYFLNKIQHIPYNQIQLVDPNLRTDYQRLRLLVQSGDNRQTLLNVAKDGGIYSDIGDDFSLDDMQDTGHFTSLLYYMGLLTIEAIDDEGRIRLKIPNYSVQTLYWEYIWKLTLDLNKEIGNDVSMQQEAVRTLAFRAEPEPYINYVSEHILKKLSNRDLTGFDEKYIKLMLLYGLYQSKLYFPVSEREVQDGYIDLYLERNPAMPNIKYEWVWELKYIKESDYNANNNLVSEKQQEALQQLAKYRQDPHFVGRDDVKYATLVFIGKKRYVIQIA